MAFTEFYLTGESGSSNLNAGSTTADVGGGSGAAIYTCTGSNFDGTSIFTPTDGSTPASTVSTGMWASLYNTADTAVRAVAQITNVAAGVNGAITVSTTAKWGTVPTSNSGSRAIKVGGAWADFAILGGAATAFGAATTIAQSTRINVKAGTYADTTTNRTFGLTGTGPFPIVWRGYKTTPGDQDTNFQAVKATDIPYHTATTGLFSIGATHHHFMNMAFTSAQVSATSGTITGSNPITLWNCQVACTSANANGSAIRTASGSSMFIASQFSATTTASSCIQGASIYSMLGCYVVGGIVGALNGNSTTSILNSIFDTQAGDCIQLGSGLNTIESCTFYNGTGNGVNITTLSNSVLVANCYFEGLATAAKANVNNTSGGNTDLIRYIGSAYFNCTADTAGFGDYPTFGLTGSLGASALTAPASQDFSPLAAIYSIGVPSYFPTLTAFRSYSPAGAVDPQATGGGAQPVGASGGLIQAIIGF